MLARYPHFRREDRVTFKYAEGQAVEYTPLRGLPALFKVVRQMPEESQADRKYRIKSEGEGFERNVLERDLGATDKTADMYSTPVPVRISGGRHRR
jgi:hypothetical protein